MDPKQIKHDEFVNKVNDTSKDAQQKIVLSGYVGKSPNADCIRIYANISLSSYCEVKTSDIIHQESLPASPNQLGGSIIWIKADAKISYGSDSYHVDAQNNYFKGDIANAFYGAAGINAMAHPGLPTTGVRSVCTDCVQQMGLPTTGVRSVCTDCVQAMGLPTTGVRSVCTDCVQAMGLPTTGVRSVCTDCVQAMGLPTTGVRSVCTDCVQAMGLPTTGVRSVCTDCVQQMGLPTTTGVKSICTDCVQQRGLPTTTGVKGICTDFQMQQMGLPTTTTVKGICTDFQMQQNPNVMSQYCGTGNYNPYM